MSPASTSVAAVMGTRGGARKRVIERQESYVERLQAVSRCVKTVDDILEEFFPFQANYRLAESLVTPPLNKKRTESSESKRLTRATPSSPVYRGATTRKKRLALTTPLQAIERSTASRDFVPSSGAASKPRTPTATSSTTHSDTNASIAAREQDQHTLALWEDKFRGRRLSPQDVLLLVMHGDVARVLESAGLLRKAGVTYDQLMELEVALESLRKAQSVVCRERTATVATPRSEELYCESSLYKLLRDNVWLHGVAFKVKSSLYLTASSGTVALSPRKGLLTPLSPAIERVSTCPVLPVISSPAAARSPTKGKQRLATALPYDRKFVASRESNTEQEQRSEYRQRLREESEAQRQSASRDKQYRQVGKSFMRPRPALTCVRSTSSRAKANWLLALYILLAYSTTIV